VTFGSVDLEDEGGGIFFVGSSLRVGPTTALPSGNAILDQNGLTFTQFGSGTSFPIIAFDINTAVTNLSNITNINGQPYIPGGGTGTYPTDASFNAVRINESGVLLFNKDAGGTSNAVFSVDPAGGFVVLQDEGGRQDTLSVGNLRAYGFGTTASGSKWLNLGINNSSQVSLSVQDSKDPELTIIEYDAVSNVANLSNIERIDGPQHFAVLGASGNDLYNVSNINGQPYTPGGTGAAYPTDASFNSIKIINCETTLTSTTIPSVSPILTLLDSNANTDQLATANIYVFPPNTDPTAGGDSVEIRYVNGLQLGTRSSNVFNSVINQVSSNIYTYNLANLNSAEFVKTGGSNIVKLDLLTDIQSNERLVCANQSNLADIFCTGNLHFYGNGGNVGTEPFVELLAGQSGSVFQVNMVSNYTPINISNGSMALAGVSTIAGSNIALSNVATINGQPYSPTSVINRSVYLQNYAYGTQPFLSNVVTTIVAMPNQMGSNVYASMKVRLQSQVIGSSNANNDFVVFLSDTQNGQPVSGTTFADDNLFDAETKQPLDTGWFYLESAFSNAGSTLYLNVLPQAAFSVASGLFVSGLLNLTPSLRVNL
jgi:hypothetical protein